MIAVPDLKFDVTRDELVAHLGARATFHRGRQEHYEARAGELRAKLEKASVDGELNLPEDLLALIDVEPASGFRGMGGMGMGVVPMLAGARGAQARAAIQDKIRAQVGNVARGLDQQAKGHAAIAARFDFFAAHVPAGEGPTFTSAKPRTFSLGFADLERLEFVTSGFVPHFQGPGGLGDYVQVVGGDAF